MSVQLHLHDAQPCPADLLSVPGCVTGVRDSVANLLLLLLCQLTAGLLH